MKTRWIIIVGIILAMIGVCVLMGVVGWLFLAPAFSHGLNISPISIPLRSAEESQTQSFSVKSPATLDLENYFGNIDISVPLSGTAQSQSGEIKIDYKKTAWGASDSEAQSNLKNTTVSMKQSGDQVTVRIEDQYQDGLVINGQSTTVDFTISVPEKTNLVIHTRNGDIILDGTQGKADLNSEFGSIEVSNVAGGLAATSNNGKVRARHIRLLDSGSGDISLKSSFGDVSLDDADTQKINAESTNGAVSLTNVTASGDISLSSNFGSISISKGKGANLQANTNHGTVTILDVSLTGRLTAGSEFGDVKLTQAIAQGYNLQSKNGAISADRVGGEVTVSSDFGEIVLTGGVNSILDLETKNGKITYEGSLGNKDQSIQNDFGDILLTLPEETALNFDFRTDFGSISSDFPVTINGGALEEKHWSGTINGGGPKMTATTKNGDINIQISK